MPDDLFSDAKVTVDIVFLHKGKSQNSPAWTKVRKMMVSGYSMYLNEYYHQHRNHIIGELSVVDMYSRKGLTCKKDCANLFEKLEKFIENKPLSSHSKGELEELKGQVNTLCQELAKLSQAFISASQMLTTVTQKITALDIKL